VFIRDVFIGDGTSRDVIFRDDTIKDTIINDSIIQDTIKDTIIIAITKDTIIKDSRDNRDRNFKQSGIAMAVQLSVHPIAVVLAVQEGVAVAIVRVAISGRSSMGVSRISRPSVRIGSVGGSDAGIVVVAAVPVSGVVVRSVAQVAESVVGSVVGRGSVGVGGGRDHSLAGGAAHVHLLGMAHAPLVLASISIARSIVSIFSISTIAMVTIAAISISTIAAISIASVTAIAISSIAAVATITAVAAVAAVPSISAVAATVTIIRSLNGSQEYAHGSDKLHHDELGRQ